MHSTCIICNLQDIQMSNHPSNVVKLNLFHKSRSTIIWIISININNHVRSFAWGYFCAIYQKYIFIDIQFSRTYLTTKLALFDAATKNTITLPFNILAHFLHFFRQVHVTQNAISIQCNRRNMLIDAYCSK